MAIAEMALASGLGAMLIVDLEDELKLEISDRDEDTIAGVVLSELGRRPRVGDRAVVGPLRLDVLEVQGNRIRSLRIQVERPDDEAAPPAESYNFV